MSSEKLVTYATLFGPKGTLAYRWRMSVSDHIAVVQLVLGSCRNSPFARLCWLTESGARFFGFRMARVDAWRISFCLAIAGQVLP
jgi:hypothetical protein